MSRPGTGRMVYLLKRLVQDRQQVTLKVETLLNAHRPNQDTIECCFKRQETRDKRKRKENEKEKEKEKRK